ncbi:Six-hairpin glycosidase-like protein [Dactylonectria macrodidyma]|uniref:Six-hairpin glycosidase-like protein n=1 Tax=Dactylonectria macrodidyma TaxID=307937 RepID=A0A9P9F4N7_9HYPO|nr:Six-hairpin glycosidase-like protein [Dactylonectria macrodidyma]
MDSSLLDTTWIWHPQWTDYAEGSAGGFVHFRKSLTLEEIPASPLNIQITADTKYKLYINGCLIQSGPVKGDKHLWFYDDLDIQPHLKLGVNHIGVHVLRFYHATPYATSFPRMRIPGLFVRTPDVHERETFGVQSDSTWEAALDLSRRLRIDQKEDDFLNVYEDVNINGNGHLNWVAVQCLDLPKSHGISPPWVLSPRLIPFSQITPVALKAVHNIQSVVPRETWEGILIGLGKDQPTAKTLRLPAGTSHHLELEANHHLTALLHFRFQRPEKRGSMLRITYSECYEDAPDFVPYVRCKGDRCDSDKRLYGPEDRYHFEGRAGAESAVSLHYTANSTGEEIFSPFHFRTLRYMALDIDVDEDCDLVLNGIDLDMTHYPLKITGSVKVPDTPENSIYPAMWEVSSRTLTNCMHDCYEDCPFYEQLQYAMDVRSSCLFTYYASGDDRMARQAIIQLHNSYRPGLGLIESRSPCHQLQIIPNFSLFWICTVVDHFEHFGDVSFTRQFLPVCDGILESFSGRIDKGLGLVSCQKSVMATYWDFVDWTKEWKPMGIPPAAERSGYQTYTNMLYAYTLRQLATIVGLVGRPGLKDEYEFRADAIVGAVRNHCRAGELFTDGLASAGPEEAFSQHTQIWAILSGAMAGKTARDVLSQCLPILQASSAPTSRTFIKPSLAMSFYTLRALSAVGESLYDDAFHGIWQPWREQLSLNLTTWCEDDVTQRSDCHAWSCAPLYEMTAEVAGIRPAEPGWTVIGFKPRTGLFSEFEGMVPLGGKLAPGVAHVSWRRGNAKVSVSLELQNISEEAIQIRVTFPDGHVEEHVGRSLALSF